MGELMSWAKENYDLITLLVGILGVVIAFISLIYTLKERKKKRESIKAQIATKEAQLRAMELSLRAGFNVSEFGSLNMQTASLQAEIDQLKKQL